MGVAGMPELLQQRRHNSRIALLYKVKNNLVEVPAEYHPFFFFHFAG